MIPKLPNFHLHPKTPICTTQKIFGTKCRNVVSSKFGSSNGKGISLTYSNGLHFGLRGFAQAKITNLDKEINHAKQIIHREANVEENKKFGEELKSLFAQSRHPEAFSKYDSFRRYQVVTPENIILVMKQYMNLQRFGKVRDLFFHLKAHQVQPALEIYELQIEATFLEKNKEKTVSFFKRLEADGWNPTEYILQTVLRSHLQHEKAYAVEQLITEFKDKFNCKWNTIVLNEYITYLIDNANQARAEQFMLNKDLPRDELSYARLIEFYTRYHAADKIEQAVEHLRQHNIHQQPFGIIPDCRFQKMKIPKLIFRMSYHPEASAVGVAWEGGARAFHLGAVTSELEALLLGFNAALSMVDINTLEEVAVTYPAILNILSSVNQKGMDEIEWSNMPYVLLLRNILKFLGQSPKGIKLTSVSSQDQDWKTMSSAAIKVAKKERDHIVFDPVVNPSKIIPNEMAVKYIGLVEGIKGSSAHDL